jgi:hypothetical protein
MRSVIRRPIPTEYKGVRFDSKSEAVFARMLDLSGIKWERVHPILHDGHSWDFLVWIKIHNIVAFFENGYRDGDAKAGKSEIYQGPEKYEAALIELKPSKPTDTYIKNIAVRSDARLCSEHRFVVWGNPFGNRQEFGGIELLYLAQQLPGSRDISYRSSAEPLPLDLLLDGFKPSFAKEAVGFRFDLAEPTEADECFCTCGRHWNPECPIHDKLLD